MSYARPYLGHQKGGSLEGIWKKQLYSLCEHTDRSSNQKVFVAELDLWPGEVLVAIEFFAKHKEETCTRNSRES